MSTGTVHEDGARGRRGTMGQEDRERWNRKHGGAGKSEPSAALVELARWLPTEGRALDVAGGAGANAVWLARQGLEVTVADISEVGLSRAMEHARQSGVELRIERVDLERDPLPAGPWALVLCSHYLQRDLMPRLAARLEPVGRMVWIHPTTTNLERHRSPSARYLLHPGEARAIAESASLRVLWYEEAWVGEGDSARHLACLVAEAIA